MAAVSRSSLTRRRFLAISACAVSTPAFAGQVTRWRGRALGAPAQMILTGLGRYEAETVFRAVEQEIDRLERVFSLFRDESELARLNRSGRLPNPSSDLLEVIDLSERLNTATGGAFDPSVQPVWQALARGARLPEPNSTGGWSQLRVSQAGLHFSAPGMAITLNGIAQGYVTDKVAALLRARGLSGLAIDMGELAALGTRPDGTWWTAGIAGAGEQVVHRVALRDRALATSMPAGTLIGPARDRGHIVDPRDPTAEPRNRLVSVSAPLASVADGLSTALCLLDRATAEAAVAVFEGARIEWMA